MLLYCHVSSTCGILHCYGGGNGFYRNPANFREGFPIERTYLNPTGDASADAKYVHFYTIVRNSYITVP